jgi:hypothetical protein
MKDTIPGIYNYCDRWCERCPLSNRCLLYLQELEGEFEDDDSAAENETFWGELENNMRENIEEIEEFISDYEDFIPPNEEELEEAMKEMEETSEKARDSRLLKLCGVYRETIRPWLEKTSAESLNAMIESGTDMTEKNQKMASDCLEVLSWYLFFTEAKFYRALTGKIAGEEIRFEPDYPTDSEASAKVAMIAVDRCRNAIISLWDLLPKNKDEDTLFHAISLLDKVKREALKEFPTAPLVRRPGFDD